MREMWGRLACQAPEGNTERPRLGSSGMAEPGESCGEFEEV
jgi:hypothetical protein